MTELEQKLLDTLETETQFKNTLLQQLQLLFNNQNKLILSQTQEIKQLTQQIKEQQQQIEKLTISLQRLTNTLITELEN